MANLKKRIRHPYHLKKLYVHWRLRVITHPHTFKRVHHQHTSYPLLALILLGVAAVIVNSTVHVYAGTTDSFSVNVSAKVLGVAPTVPATIDTPADKASFTATPITVTGTCPDKTYVKLFRNNFPSGTALCTAGLTYSIQTDLFEGGNTLTVRDYNYADQAGPDSSPITVTYTPPVVTPPVQGSGASSTPTSTPTSTPNHSDQTPVVPLTLTNNFHFQGYAAGTPASWQVAIAGGTAPYSISVSWGDGQTALYTSPSADTLTLSHTYADAAANNGSYRIIVTASDAAGNHTSLQLVALITNADTSAASGTSNGGSTKASGSSGLFGLSVQQVIGSIWSVYGGLCVMLLSFWLGEIHQIRIFRMPPRINKG
jgi:hypothetical protein